MCRALLVATVFASATMFFVIAGVRPTVAVASRCSMLSRYTSSIPAVDILTSTVNTTSVYFIGVVRWRMATAELYPRSTAGLLHVNNAGPTCCGVSYPMESEPVGAVIQQPMPEAQFQQRFESGTVTVEPPPDADRLPSNPRGRDQ